MNAQEWPVRAVDYHAAQGILGHGMFEDFLVSPRLFRGRWVTGEIEKRKETEALFLGRLIHTALLEPLTLERRYAKVPDLAPDGTRWDRSGKARAAAWGKVAISCWGKTPVVESDWRVMEKIRDLVPANETALAIRDAPGMAEAGLLWSEGDIRCKTLRDKVLVDGNVRTIVDVKSMDQVSPAAFRRWAGKFALHRTAAWYLRGERALYPEAVVNWLCWAVSKETGESAIYELHPDDLDVAAGEIGRGLDRFAECLETGRWRASWESGVTRVSLAPGAVFYSEL